MWPSSHTREASEDFWWHETWEYKCTFTSCSPGTGLREPGNLGINQISLFFLFLAPPGTLCHLCISRGVTAGTFYIILSNVHVVLNRGWAFSCEFLSTPEMCVKSKERNTETCIIRTLTVRTEKVAVDGSFSLVSLKLEETRDTLILMVVA